MARPGLDTYPLTRHIRRGRATLRLFRPALPLRSGDALKSASTSVGFHHPRNPFCIFLSGRDEPRMIAAGFDRPTLQVPQFDLSFVVR
jgi:hypothetical protein